jgi:hypothetical protein
VKEEEGVGKVARREVVGGGRGEGRAAFTSTSGTTTLCCWAATAGDARGRGTAATEGVTLTAPISTTGVIITSCLSTAPAALVGAAALSSFLTGAKRVRVSAAAMD